MSKRYQGCILGVGFNPLQAPNAPTIGTATGGSNSVSVAFTAPANVGGSAITSYAAQATPGGAGATGASSPITFSGLSAGTSYTFTVTALNSYGPSPASAASNSASPISYWIGRLTGASGDAARSVSVDGSGNVYICGYLDSSGGATDLLIAKYNSSGTIQWQRSLNSVAANTNDQGFGIAVDASGNAYVCGGTNGGGTNYNMLIAKYDTNGTIQWQRTFGNTSPEEYASSIALDSSGNCYVCGYTSVSGSYDIEIVKYDSSGTLQWQRRINGASGNTEFGNGIAVDSNSVAYACGWSNDSGPEAFVIAKYNSAGGLNWTTTLRANTGSANERAFGIAVDSSSNIYVCGQSRVTNNTDAQIVKYNTSASLQWQRRLYSASTDVANSVAVDSSGNSYLVGYTGTDILIAKYNTSGTIQWQRTLSSSGDDVGFGVTVDSSGTVYVVGSTNVGGTNDCIIAKLPSDGSLTGTYTVGGSSFTYAASSLTDAATSLIDPGYNLNGSTSTMTSATATLTDAASTLTSSVTTL